MTTRVGDTGTAAAFFDSTIEQLGRLATAEVEAEVEAEPVESDRFDGTVSYDALDRGTLAAAPSRPKFRPSMHAEYQDVVPTDANGSMLVSTREYTYRSERDAVQAKKEEFNATIDERAAAVSKSMDKGLGTLGRLSRQTRLEMQREIDQYKQARNAADQGRLMYDEAKDKMAAAEKSYAIADKMLQRADLMTERDRLEADVERRKEIAEHRADAYGRLAKTVGYVGAGSMGDAEAEIADLAVRELTRSAAAGDIAGLESKLKRLDVRIEDLKTQELKDAVQKARSELEAARDAVQTAAGAYVAGEQRLTRALDRLVTLEQPCGTDVFQRLRDYRINVAAAGYELHQAGEPRLMRLDDELLAESSQGQQQIKQLERDYGEVVAERLRTQGADSAPGEWELELKGQLVDRLKLSQWAASTYAHDGQLLDELRSGAHLRAVDGAIDEIYGALGGTRDERVIPRRG